MTTAFSLAWEADNFKPFSKPFQNIPGFPEIEQLFKQGHVGKQYPFSLQNNPIVDYGKNEDQLEDMDKYCSIELGKCPEDAGIDPEDTEFEKTEKEIQFEKEKRQINENRHKLKKQKKTEKMEAQIELRKIGKDIKGASDAFVRLTGVNAQDDLRIRKKCCCPDFVKVAKSWDKKSGLECPNPTPKNPQGIGMCSPFGPTRCKNLCAWQFQQFCSYGTKEKYIKIITSRFCFGPSDVEKWTLDEKLEKVKEYYDEIEEIREEVRLEIANNINAYFRYKDELQERRFNNTKTLEQNKKMAMRKTLLYKLKERGLREVQVPGDGNCQFRALSEQLYGNEDTYKAIRARVVEHLRENKKRYEGFVEGTYKGYVDKMSQDESWGDNTTLQAFANIHFLRIKIYTDYDYEDEDDWIIKILPRDDDGEELEFLSTIRLSFYSECHYNSVRDVPERTPSPQPSVSTPFEDLTTPQRKKALEKQEDTYLYYSRDEEIENLRKRKRKLDDIVRKGEIKVLKGFRSENEAEAHFQEVRKSSAEAEKKCDNASNMPWNKVEKNKLNEFKLIHQEELREAKRKRDEATKAREEAEQDLKSIIEQVEKEEFKLEEELAMIRNNPTTPDELRKSLEQMRLESNNDDYDDDYDEDNDDDKKSNRSGYSSANSYYSGEAVEAMEEIHKKKQKIAVKKHEAILDAERLNHKRELEKKETEIKDKEQELLLARQLRHDYEDLEKANEDLKSLNENQAEKMDELNNKNEELKSLNKELRKAIEMKELKSSKENKKSVSFEDLENAKKTEEENKELKELLDEQNKEIDELKKEIDEMNKEIAGINEEFEKGLREERERWIKEKREVQKQYEDEVKTNVANIKAKKKLTEENQDLQKQILNLEEEIATVKLKPYVGKELDGMIE